MRDVSEDERDISENTSPLARRFQMLESFHIAEYAY